MMPPYICGPLTELSEEEQELVKALYVKIANLFKEMIGVRAWVPHEHFDPDKHPNFTPRQVDEAERNIVCNKTSLLVVVAVAPSWGGGIEVEMAHQNNVRAVILHQKDKKISRLLRGNPTVKKIIEFDDYDDAITKLREWIAIEINRHLLVGRGIG